MKHLVTFSQACAWAGVALLIVMLSSCGESTPQGQSRSVKEVTEKAPSKIMAPSFNPDSAYAFIEKQLAFGPRVPNTAAHAACADWLATTLEGYGAQVTVQTGIVQAWDLEGNKVQLGLKNIIASYKPESNRRILLSAHWDTRPFADAGPEGTEKEPIPGANDGGSGVAVLLEIARQLGQQQPEVGVDIILWDAEDHGNANIEDSYCLGSQYWARNLHKPHYKAMYGINLDMVGAANAYFQQDPISRQYAGAVVDKVWRTAAELGYGSYFPSVQSHDILDDHVYVNFIAQIPCIDIIDQPASSGKTFFPQWHTLEDDLSIISKPTLKAVGQTVMEVVYREK